MNKNQYQIKTNPLKYALLLFMGLILVAPGCTDLEEKPFSEITEKSFTPSEEDVTALIATTYTPLRYIMGWQGLFDVQEEPADIMVTPTRPNGWDDGGTYKRMHRHTWDNEQWQPRNTWLTCYEGINNSNRVIMQIESGSLPLKEEQIPAVLAELRAVRALWYSILVDTHGNVPIVTSFSEEAKAPEQNTRSEVYNFIVTELTDVIPQLSEEVGQKTYGRMTKWAGYTLLARMYLNAEVYNGTAEWGKVIDACDKVIESQLFSLEDNYRDLFSTNNQNSSEIIFAVPYDDIQATNWNQHMKMLLPDHRHVFNMTTQPWGGSSANPQFINSYHPEDKRMDDTWLHGDQLDADDGSVVMTLVNEMPSIEYCEFTEGFRCGKYEIKDGCKSALSNDFPYFRYADVLMMKAEALLRTDLPDQAAQLVTDVRMRSFDDPADATVTGAELQSDCTFQFGTLDTEGNIDAPGDQSPVQYGRFLDELGWEFAAEARRRTDLIRFGVFTTKNWYNHTPNGDHTILFPIGIQELNTNPNLEQNPGYNG